MTEVRTHVLCGEEVILHPSKALYWPRENLLVIADLHAGKANHFRKAGMAVPQTVNQNNFERLGALIGYFSPERVLFLGDLFHSSWNKGWEELASWFKSYPDVRFELVPGNHDFLPSSAYEMAALAVQHEGLTLPPFRFLHQPPDDDEIANHPVHGHQHPGVIMRGKGRQRARLPCFYFTQERAVLPAFGSFTGLSIVKPTKQDHVFPVVANKVIEPSTLE